MVIRVCVKASPLVARHRDDVIRVLCLMMVKAQHHDVRRVVCAAAAPKNDVVGLQVTSSFVPLSAHIAFVVVPMLVAIPDHAPVWRIVQVAPIHTDKLTTIRAHNLDWHAHPFWVFAPLIENGRESPVHPICCPITLAMLVKHGIK